MIKKNIYKDFRDYTGLSDSVYETIFSRIEENLYKLNDLKWLYFIYNDKDADTTSMINFSKDETIPLYVVELIKNAFGNYYTLPKSVVVTIGMSYKDAEHLVICNSEGTTIPDEINFIKDYFHLFFMTHPVRDIFFEYDSIFSFIDKFKNPVKGIFPALEKKFGTKISKFEVESQGINQKNIMTEKLLIDSLEEKISQVLTRIEHIKMERENLQNNKSEMFEKVNNRESLMQEREKFAIENQMLSESKKTYEDRLLQLNNIIKDIDAELSFMVDRGGNDEDLRYLHDKKIVFDHDRTSVEKTLKDISLLVRTSGSNIEILSKEIQRIDSYKDTDLSSIDTRINQLNAEQDILFKEMLNHETKLKGIKSKNLDKQLKFEQSHSYADATISNIENNTIVTHLSSSLQPLPVTIIANYLRYFFGYHTTNLASNLMEQFPNNNIYVIQALASRQVLTDYFGLYFNNFFSVFPIENPRIENTLLIVKES